MAANLIPTSSDIYLEVDGKKVAVVQSYTAQSTKSSTTVEAFGEREPVATIPGQSRHVLELTRIYATDEALADGIHFHDLEDFSDLQAGPAGDLQRVSVEQDWRERHAGRRCGGKGHGNGGEED